MPFFNLRLGSAGFFLSLKIDLHCHSTHSDGTWGVKRLLKEANNKKVQGFAITDHDTLAGSQEAFLNKNTFKGKLISGMEVSTNVRDINVHFLAYFPEFNFPDGSNLVKTLIKIQDDRIIRMQKMIDILNSLDIEITMEEVLAEATKGTNPNLIPKKIVSRPHLARVLVSRNFVPSVRRAFELYLKDGGLCYVPRFTLECREWVNQIKKIGGIVIWAHPLYGHGNNWEHLKLVAEDLKRNGIHGIEKIYNYDKNYPINEKLLYHGKEILRSIFSSDEKTWLFSAGGDFHGDKGTLGTLNLPLSDWKNFLEALYSDRLIN